MTMSKLNRYWALIIILLIVIIVIGGIVVWFRYSPSQPIEISIPPRQELVGRIYIDGAVTNPGFYPLTDRDSLEALIQAAGGNTTSANLSGLKLYIPGLGEEEEKQKVTSPPPALYRKDYLSEAKPSATDEREGAKDGIAQKMKEEDKKLPAPPFKEEMATAEPLRPKEMIKAEAPPLEEKRRESERVGKVMMSLAKKPAREITLKISDRVKAVSRLQELVKQLVGEVVRED